MNLKAMLLTSKCTRLKLVINKSTVTKINFINCPFQESLKKIYHWVSEEKKHVRFGTWDTKEVSKLLPKLF